MDKNSKILLLNLPSPPNLDIYRDAAGGFGVSFPCSRNDYGENMEKTLHPFLPYASSVLLDAECEFNVLDCQNLKLNKVEVLNAIKKENPDIIFSLLNLPSLKKDLELLNEIKRDNPNISIIGVGTVCHVLPNEILRMGGVDVILRDRYPHVENLANLVRAVQGSRRISDVGNVSYIKEGRIIHTPDLPEVDLSKFPPPSYERIKLDGYESVTDLNGERNLSIFVLGSKGCPYQCIYCPYPVGFGRKPSYRTPKQVVDEIEYLHTARKIRGFVLREQSFTLDLKRAEEICDEIIRRNLDIVWGCEARVDAVSRELLKKMKKSGCIRVHYGVESGDPEILKIAKPGVTLERIKKAFRMTKEAKILTGAHMILGWPNDNLKTVENTYKLIAKVDPDSVYWNFLTPYPGTKIREIAQKNNLILTNDWSHYTSHTVVMKTKHLNAQQLYMAERRIIRNLAKKKLWKLILQSDINNLKKFRPIISETKGLVGRIFFPQKC